VSNVVAMPTAPNGDQGWQCKVCKQYFTYSQPINFHLASQMAYLFLDYHDDNCRAPKQKKEALDEH
jgi:hypothetical protein